MVEWPKVAAKSHVQFTRGVSWTATSERDLPTSSTHRVLRIPNIQTDLVFDNVLLVDFPGGVPDNCRATPGTILMVGSNGNPRRVGNAVQISPRDGEFLFASFLIAARAHSRLLNERFLFHWITSGETQDMISNSVQGTTGLSNLSMDFLSGLLLPFPPLEEQRRIAEVLDTIDESIQATERVIVKLRTMREGILRDQLSVLLDYPMTSVEHLGAEVNVGIVVRPTQYYASEGIPVLRSANVRESGLDMTNLVYMSPESHRVMAKSAVAPGDLLTVRTGYPGTTAVVSKAVPEANCVDVVITRTGNAIDPEFLSMWINSDFGKGHVLARQGGLAQQHFNVSDMKVLPVPVVDFSIQKKLVGSDRTLRSRQDGEQTGLEKLRATRAGLAADLLSGRIRTGEV